MQFTDIVINQFGTLNSLSLSHLSSGLTLIYGGNGSGKTTLAHFIRGLVFGFNSKSVSQGFVESTASGEISIDRDHYRPESTLNRQSIKRTASLSRPDGILQDNHSGNTLSGFPVSSWITEAIFQDIFTVGYQEADRFDTLLALCLEDSSLPAGTQSEIQKTERAIEQCVAERAGSGHNSGLSGRIQALNLQKDSLQRELDQSRQHDPQIAIRIGQIERAISDVYDQINKKNDRITMLESEISQLKRTIAEAKLLNQLPLDQESIERQIHLLQGQQSRWSSILENIRAESQSFSNSDPSTTDATESLIAIRALITRLEERLQQNSHQPHSVLQTSNTDNSSHEISTEIYALCDFMSQHESAVAAYENSVIRMLADRASLAVSDLNKAIQSQIAALQTELNYANDVLSSSLITQQITPCQNAGHRQHHNDNRSVISKSHLLQMEQQLTVLQNELQTEVQERDRLANSRDSLVRELEEQKRLLNGTATLEEIESLKARLLDIDAELELLQSRIQVLQRTETYLHEVLVRLKKQKQPSTLMLWPSGRAIAPAVLFRPVAAVPWAAVSAWASIDSPAADAVLPSELSSVTNN